AHSGPPAPAGARGQRGAPAPAGATCSPGAPGATGVGATGSTGSAGATGTSGNHDDKTSLTTTINPDTTIGALNPVLLKLEAAVADLALAMAGGSMNGQQLQADLTTIKSLAQMLLSRMGNTDGGSAFDQNRPGGAGTIGQLYKSNWPNLNLPNHDS
ncbi:MAG: collagen-like protein, partial [Bradyrhizobium sp.]